MKALLFLLVIGATLAFEDEIMDPAEGAIDDMKFYTSEYRRTFPRYTLHVLKTGSAHYPPTPVSNKFNPADLDYLESISLIGFVGFGPAIALGVITPILFCLCCWCCGKASKEETVTAMMNRDTEFAPNQVSRWKRYLISIICVLMWIFCIIGWAGNGVLGNHISNFISHINDTAKLLDAHAESTATDLRTLATHSMIDSFSNVTNLLKYGDYARTSIIPMLNNLGNLESWRLLLLHGSLIITAVIALPAFLGVCFPKMWKCCSFAWLLMILAWLVMVTLVCGFGLHFALSIPVVDVCPAIESYIAYGNLTEELDSLLYCTGDTETRPFSIVLDSLVANTTAELQTCQGQFRNLSCPQPPGSEHYQDCVLLKSYIVRDELILSEGASVKSDLDSIANCNITRNAIPKLEDIVCSGMLTWLDVISVMLLLISCFFCFLFIPLHILIERSFRAHRPQFMASVFAPYARRAAAAAGAGTSVGNELVGKPSRTTHVQL